MKTKKTKKREIKGFDHQCDWRKAAIKLASCVVATIQTDGKIGIGSGMVMKVVDGKRIVERWDKDFIEALAFIGIEVGPAKKPRERIVAKPGVKKKVRSKIAVARGGVLAA